MKLGLNRNQYTFLNDPSAVDQFERLFRRVNNLHIDGGEITAATVLPILDTGETVTVVYKNTSGVGVNISLPISGAYNYRYLANGGTGLVGRAVTGGVIASLGAGAAVEICYTRV